MWHSRSIEPCFPINGVQFTSFRMEIFIEVALKSVCIDGLKSKLIDVASEEGIHVFCENRMKTNLNEKKNMKKIFY